MGAEIVVAVDVLGKVQTLDKHYNMLTVVLRMFEIMDSHLSEHKTRKNKPNLLLRPDLGNMSQYKFKDLQTAYEKGYQIGSKYAPKIKKLLS